jgi:hypothetical protein
VTSDEQRGLLGLHAGSRMPDDSDEIDEMLRHVPEMAFIPELEASVFCVQAISAVAAFVASAQIARLADEPYLRSLRGALAAAGERARREQNGGLEFLSATLSHFLDQLPPHQHPLVVAMWCRGWARRRGQDDVPPAIAAAMDEYEDSQDG